MKRTLKQFLYGGFFVLLTLLVLWFLNTSFLAPSPTCSDGIQNQGELGVDCGGPCESCDTANLEALRIEPGIQKISFNSNHVAFVRLSNPNPSYSGAFDYKITFLSEDERVVDEAYGSSYALPKEEDYITENSSLNFSTVKFEILGTQWEKQENPLKPQISETSARLTDEGMSIAGTVVSESSGTYESVSVIAVFRDSSGFNELFFAQELLSNFGPFEERSFSMNINISDELKEEVDLNNTRYYISVNR